MFSFIRKLDVSVAGIAGGDAVAARADARVLACMLRTPPGALLARAQRQSIAPIKRRHAAKNYRRGGDRGMCERGVMAQFRGICRHATDES